VTILRDADRALGRTQPSRARPRVARPPSRLPVHCDWSTAASAQTGPRPGKRGTDAALTADPVDMFRVFPVPFAISRGGSGARR
jgi:hypothetical protein